jgi:hypothetical protein
MSALNDYINAVERNLIGIERRKKREILRDIRQHILSMSEDHGGGEEGVKKAISEIEAPERLAEMYVERYGLKNKGLALATLISLGLTFLTLPIIPFTTVQNPASLLFLPILMLYIAYNGMKYGVKSALIPASLSALLRSALFYITLWMFPFDLVADSRMVLAVHAMSLLVVIMSFGFPVPGRE